MLTERAAKILEATVQDFIEIGEPISSEWLYNHHDFGIKPATIRLELLKLAEEGFLEQPYFPAGRIPSDKGFEFFAERVFSSQQTGAGFHGENLCCLLRRKAWQSLAEKMSAELELLSVVGDCEKDKIYKEGLDELVDSLGVATAEEIKSVIKDFVEIDERFERFGDLLDDTDGGPAVFIGKQSPLTRSSSLAVVAGKYDVGGDEILLAAVGSKRMNYKKAASVFKNLKYAGRK
jgi:transcriptional regulator of heat shock response